MPTRPHLLNTDDHKVGEDCLAVESLAAYAEHKLTHEETLTVESHLADCQECRWTIILTCRNKGLVDELTSANPTDP